MYSYIEAKLKEFLSTKFSIIHQNRDMIWALDDTDITIKANVFAEFMQSLCPDMTVKRLLEFKDCHCIETPNINGDYEVEYTFFINPLIEKLNPAEINYV